MLIEPDILVFAAVAAMLIARLWSVLGTRNDGDTIRPNPVAQHQPEPAIAARPHPFSLAPPPTSVAGGLLAIQSIDTQFDEKQFLQHAHSLFTTVIEAYAANNFDRLVPLTSPALLESLQKAAAVRSQAGQIASSRVLALTDCDIIAASVNDTQAMITVKFISRQENILRDARGIIIGGHEGISENVTDLWVFGRDVSSSDSKWIVIETRA